MNTASFINRTKVEIYKSGDNKVVIMKATKEGTNRVFFYPETIDGKRINATMHARKYDAISLGKMYLKKISTEVQK